MRLFQNSGLYRGYVPRLRALVGENASYAEQRATFLNDRFGAPHILKPVLDGEKTAFFTNGDDQHLQRTWGRENGLSEDASLEDILLAQIEEHRTEVFYNLDPIRYPSSFLKRLPKSVRFTIGWRAAPLSGADLTGYDLIVSNFPEILKKWNDAGISTALLFPAHDPVFDEYNGHKERSVDVLFVGGYSRHHLRRTKILEAVASLSPTFRVEYRLDNSRLTNLAESPLGLFPPLSDHRRPKTIRAVSSSPVFGRELYALLASSKVVINAAIDMAGEERGNMRCFEALGAGAVLVSDRGVYPPGMEDGKTLVTYDEPLAARAKIEQLLTDPDGRISLAVAGQKMIARNYSKTAQMARFDALVQNHS